MASSQLRTEATHTGLIRGSQLLPVVVDERARSSPDALWAEYPKSLTGYEEGFLKITCADLANAVNRLAWWLHEELPRGETFQTLAYVGPNDLRYIALILGAVKAGYKLLLTSPRNSISAHSNLLKHTKCNVMITPSPQPPAVTAILAHNNLRVLKIPTVDELLDSKSPHYPYEKTFEEARNDPLVVLHTSGSTGLPKPVVLTNDWIASWRRSIELEPPKGFRNQDRMMVGKRVFNPFPPFHAGGILSILCFGVLYSVITVIPPANVISSAKVAMDCIKKTKVDIMLLPPPSLEEIGRSPEMLDFFCQNVEMIVYSGGDIPPATGDEISKRIKLSAIFASSECGFYPRICQADEWPTEDWRYFRFNPAAGIELEHRSENSYEAVFKRHLDPELEQSVFKLFPDLQEYRTKDLFTPHPSKADLWSYSGRFDDVIVFLNGEKTNPVSMEQHISLHPDVRGVLVVGALRFQAVLLIEIATERSLSTAQRAEYIERLWPTIQEANQECPYHAKIVKSHILFTDHNKPMIRAGKGTVQRRATTDLYAKEIDQLYADADKMSSPSLADKDSPQPPNNLSDGKALTSYICKVIAMSTGWADFGASNNSEDFFVRGMDSFQAIQLTRSLKLGLGIPDLDISTIYTNPSVSSLTKAVLDLSVQENTLKASKEQARQRLMQSLLDEHKTKIDNIVSLHKIDTDKEDLPMDSRVVILAGSTGAHGSYLLESLLSTSTVSHIFCLNRANDGHEAQVQRNKAFGLSTEFPSNRVTFLTVNLSDSFLGLKPEVYGHLWVSTTDVIHNAWPVNFNMSLPSFHPHLSGIVNLISLVISSPHRPSLFFVSSISSVAGLTTKTLPEEIIHDFSTPLLMGYAESKFLAEHILSYAAAELPSLNIKIGRLGQIAGPTRGLGTWNRVEWFPSMIVSSLHMGMVPKSIGPSDTIEWVPIDLLARTIVELTLVNKKSSGTATGESQFYHLLNPRPAAWSALLPTVTGTLAAVTSSRGQSKTIEEVPFNVWFDALRMESEKLNGENLEESLKVNPAIKLLAFYKSTMEGRGWPAIDTKMAVESSKTFRGLEGIKQEWLEKWIEGWVGT